MCVQSPEEETINVGMDGFNSSSTNSSVGIQEERWCIAHHVTRLHALGAERRSARARAESEAPRIYVATSRDCELFWLPRICIKPARHSGLAYSNTRVTDGV